MVHEGLIIVFQMGLSFWLKKRTKDKNFNYEANRFWEFKSWDKMIMPKPFSRITYSLSEPLDILSLDKEKAKEFLMEQFDKISLADQFKE